MFILFLCVVCLLLLGFWKRRVKRSANSPPMYPGALPIIGHAAAIHGDTAHIWKLIQKATAEYAEIGGVIQFVLGPFNFYLLSDPDDCMTAVNNTSEKIYIYKFGRPWLGEGLLTASSQTWKVHRKLLNPMFTQKNLNSFIGVFNYESRRLVNILETKLDQGPFEYESCFLVWSLETICHTAIGVEVNEEGDENKKYVQAINTMLGIVIRRCTKLWLHSEFMFNLSSLKREQNQALHIIQKRTNEVLLKRKKNLNEKSLQPDVDTSDDFKPFIDHISIAAAKEGLTNAEVMDEVYTFIVSGYETIGHTLIYTLMALGDHQDVQNRIYKELEVIFGNTGRDIEKDDFSRMVYMGAVIKETLRIYPAVPIFAKYNDTDIKLSKYTLQANSNILISVLGLCRHPMWGEDADQFKPERWLDPASLPDNLNTYPVFGLGKRSCIGRTYAMMSMKTTLAHILRRYEVTTYNENPTFKMEFVLKSVTPLRIKLETRK